MNIRIEPDNQPDKVKAGINSMARIKRDSEETSSIETFRKALFDALKEANNELGPLKANVTVGNVYQ